MANTPDHLTPAEEDPVVHRFVAALARPAPRPPFETRVLTRVWRPPPRAWRAIRARLTSSWQARLLFGALAAGAFIWQFTVVMYVVDHPQTVAQLVSLVETRAWPLVELPAQQGRAWLDLAWRVFLARLIPWLWMLGVVAVVAALSAVGLVWVIRSERRSYAVR